MKIFFTGSVRAGRSHQPEYQEIVKILNDFGEVSSGHVSDDALSQFGETQLAGNEIRSREIAAIEASDVVVAEVTVPSLGVGYFIRHATEKHIPVIALYKDSSSFRLSEIIKGDPGVSVKTYTRASELRTVFEEVLKK